jgi:hypothetical protein
LNPAQVLRVELDPNTKAAIAIVPDRQLSLAIGKEGQNARLAAKLTGWNVDIKSSTEAETLVKERAQAQVVEEDAPAAATATVEAVAEPIQMPEPVASPVAEAPVEAPIDIAATVAPVETEPAAAEVEPELVEAIAEAAQAEATEIVQAAAELAPAQAETEPVEAIDIEMDEAEPEPEAAPEPDLASLRDVPEDVWSVPKLRTAPEPGVIRFAEDITGLRGGVTVRRARRSGSAPPDQGRSRRRKGRGGRSR